MTTLRISQSVAFDMAHALTNHSGKCSNIHGHCYRLTVVLRGKRINNIGAANEGMLTDYSVIRSWLKRKVINIYDHALALPHPLADQIGALRKADNSPFKLLPLSFQPTAENLLLDIYERLAECTPENLTLIALKLKESDHSSAEWHLEDQPC